MVFGISFLSSQEADIYSNLYFLSAILKKWLTIETSTQICYVVMVTKFLMVSCEQYLHQAVSLRVNPEQPFNRKAVRVTDLKYM